MTETSKSTNITWHESGVSAEERAALNGHRPALLWFTGLSGSGKSTLANGVARALHERGVHTYVLDGDNVRHGLNKDLTFSAEDRVENIRRIGEVAKLFVDAGLVTMTAFISPYREDRARARAIVGDAFIEVHVDADVAVCESRDPKGLYKKARAGEIGDFTGISSPYEAPENPELRIDTSAASLEDCVAQVVAYLASRGIVNGE
jgi:adenylylsulfate kinase